MDFIFCKLQNLRKNEFNFWQQAAGGPTGWAQRGLWAPAACERKQLGDFDVESCDRTRWGSKYWN